MFKKIVVWAVGCLLLGGATVAQEYVEFRDGRFIKAASHRVGGESMRIELGKGSWIEVPRAVVDVVEYKGRQVYRRSEPTPTDVLLAGAGEQSGAVAPLVEEVIRARRTLPDPARFRPSPFVLAKRRTLPSPR